MTARWASGWRTRVGRRGRAVGERGRRRPAWMLDFLRILVAGDSGRRAPSWSRIRSNAVLPAPTAGRRACRRQKCCRPTSAAWQTLQPSHACRSSSDRARQVALRPGAVGLKVRPSVRRSLRVEASRLLVLRRAGLAVPVVGGARLIDGRVPGHVLQPRIAPRRRRSTAVFTARPSRVLGFASVSALRGSTSPPCSRMRRRRPRRPTTMTTAMSRARRQQRQRRRASRTARQRRRRARRTRRRRWRAAGGSRRRGGQRTTRRASRPRRRREASGGKAKRTKRHKSRPMEQSSKRWCHATAW